MPMVIAAKTKHGESDRTPEYLAWKNMRRRCAKGSPWHQWYFARGIGICEEWATFEAFLRDMGRKPSPSHSIDRIDNDRGYEPSNCRWATFGEQMRNRSSNHVIAARGERRTLAEWARVANIKRETIARRLRAGWEAERAIFLPADKRFGQSARTQKRPFHDRSAAP